MVRKRVRRGGRKRWVRRRAFRIVPTARVGLGRSITLHGRLANPDGQPIDGASIEVFGKSAFGENEFAALGLARTGADGTFTYRARATASRVLRFHYRGGQQIRAATRDVFLRVPGSTAISVSDRRVFNGDRVTFRGRLRGGGIPDGGKLLEMQAFFRNRWRTFSTVRSDPRGRWRFSYQFGGTSGTHHVPIPRADPSRRRLSVRHRSLARDPGGCTGPLTTIDSAMTDRPVFYYDLNSPYSWLAAERINSVFPEPPVWKPISYAFVMAAHRRAALVGEAGP